MVQQAAQLPCPLCGGKRAVAGISHEVYWMVGTMASSSDGFDAVICLSCGYTTLHAQNLDRLARKVQEHERKRGYHS
jgi:YgiT-type zinc finger domain-containing protein